MPRIAALCLLTASLALVAYTRSPSKGDKARGKPLGRSALTGVLANWWDRPYPYMFEQGTSVLTVRGRGYGAFNAGINGIMKYGGLGPAVAAQLQLGRPSFGDLTALETLSGLKIYRQRDTSGRRFSRYNSAIIRWGYRNLVPDPSVKVLGHTCQVYYDRIFARFFRLMAESRQYLEQGARWSNEKRAYLKAMRRPRFDGISYLQKRFAGALSSSDLPQDGTSFTAPMAIGFWLRRHADGTAKELWTGLTHLLRLYDQRFLDRIGKLTSGKKRKKKKKRKKRK